MKGSHILNNGTQTELRYHSEIRHRIHFRMNAKNLLLSPHRARQPSSQMPLAYPCLADWISLSLILSFLHFVDLIEDQLPRKGNQTSISYIKSQNLNMCRMFYKFKPAVFEVNGPTPYLELTVLHQVTFWMVGSLAHLLDVAFPF